MKTATKNTPAPMTREAVIKIMKSLAKDKVRDGLLYLKSRWRDESEYEDFDDYIKHVQKLINSSLPKGYTFKVSRSFSVDIKVPNFSRTIRVKTLCDGIRVMVK